jgi:hypothetical protein
MIAGLDSAKYDQVYTLAGVSAPHIPVVPVVQELPPQQLCADDDDGQETSQHSAGAKTAIDRSPRHHDLYQSLRQTLPDELFSMVGQQAVLFGLESDGEVLLCRLFAAQNQMEIGPVSKIQVKLLCVTLCCKSV